MMPIPWRFIKGVVMTVSIWSDPYTLLLQSPSLSVTYYASLSSIPTSYCPILQVFSLHPPHSCAFFLSFHFSTISSMWPNHLRVLNFITYITPQFILRLSKFILLLLNIPNLPCTMTLCILFRPQASLKQLISTTWILDTWTSLHVHVSLAYIGVSSIIQCLLYPHTDCPIFHYMPQRSYNELTQSQVVLMD